MDYGALPPELNSARMYTGPGSGPMIAAASAWDVLAGELHSAATAYGSVITTVTSGPWVGPASEAMAAAVAPYVTWMSVTAAQAEQAGAQAQASAGAFDAAFSATVPPPVVALNRAQLMLLSATNFFGQNTAAIAANESEYAEMWAQDAATMYSYAANAASATSSVTPFGAAPETTSAGGLAAQSAAASQSAGTSVGGVQSVLSELINAVPNALQNLSSPSSSASGISGLGGTLIGTSSGTTTTTGLLGDLTSSSLGQSLLAEYGDLPGFFGMFMASNALGPLVNMDAWLPFAQQANAAAAIPAALGAAGAQAAGGFGGFAGLGGLAGLGQAGAVGGLSVPAGWGWAASGPASMLGQMPLAMPLTTVDPNLAAGLGMPMMMGGGSKGAAASGAGPGKYGMPLPAVMTRPPSAGYGPSSTAPPAAAYPMPPGFPGNGGAPPGYQPAIVYVPTNGHAPTNV